MMDLAEAIAAEPPGMRKGPLCSIAQLRRKLSDEDNALLDRLFAEVRDGERTAASMARVLTRAGHPFTGNRLAHHLRGDCKCPTS